MQTLGDTYSKASKDMWVLYFSKDNHYLNKQLLTIYN